MPRLPFVVASAASPALLFAWAQLGLVPRRLRHQGQQVGSGRQAEGDDPALPVDEAALILDGLGHRRRKKPVLVRLGIRDQVLAPTVARRLGLDIRHGHRLRSFLLYSDSLASPARAIDTRTW